MNLSPFLNDYETAKSRMDLFALMAPSKSHSILLFYKFPK